MGGEALGLVMLLSTIAVLMLGFPVAFTLAGMAVAFAGLGIVLDVFPGPMLGAIPSRIQGLMVNELLLAVPLFVFMGVMLERSGIARDLLETMGRLFGSLRGGLGISVILVGSVLAASTGIVGATVVTMGLLSLPAMLRAGYDPRLATGTICASGTLGQVIPPSIVLVLLGETLQGAYVQAQRAAGVFAPDTVSVVDLFAGALLPGLLLVGLYILWQLFMGIFRPHSCPPLAAPEGASAADLIRQVVSALIPPLFLIVAVLGSILGGIATPTEAAAVGAVGAALLALFKRKLSGATLLAVGQTTVVISAMVFAIVIGATLFALVFRGLGADEVIEAFLMDLPGGTTSAILVVMATIFVLGFFLDFVEIIFVVVPIVGPILMMMGVDPIWLGVMIAINIQTSFLTPPFGFAIFYLRSVAPESISTGKLYRGVIPFVAIQLVALALVAMFPSLATWLPGVLFG